MNQAAYWRERFAILEAAAHEKSDTYLAELERLYHHTEISVRREIESWYQRFANHNGISLSEARKQLAAGQLAEFKWTVEQYIKAGQQGNLSKEWLRKLENASARFHVSRLEAIQMQIQQQIELLYGNQVDGIDALLRKLVSDGYTSAAFEIQKGLGIGWDLTALNQAKLTAILAKPWTTDGRTFRDRCWKNKDALVNTLHKTLIQGILRGDAPEKTIRTIQKAFGSERYKAKRLVHTETSYFTAVSKRQMYHDLDIEQIEIVETLDARTCSICQSMDGMVITKAQYEPGVTVPPFHPNCRGTTCPYFADMEGERAARSTDGKVSYVPASMTYAEWKKTFVDGGSQDGLINNSESAIINLTDEEKWAINEYVSSGSYKINGLLRDGEELPAEMLEFQKHLDSALEKMPKYEGIVYRSLTFDRPEDLIKFAHKHQVGDIVPYRSYTSTSANKSFYHESPSVVIRINSKNGRDMRRYNPKENEILYGRDMKFLIKKVTLEDGIIFMEAEEVLC